MKSLLLRLAAAALVIVLPAASQAQQPPAAGREYLELSPPRPISTGGRIEVLEFFYYGCPVCYEAQPHIARWLLRAGPDVELIRVPAVFKSDSSLSFARTFYALSEMKQIARLDWPIYDNHHFDGKQLDEEKNITEWVAANGVDRDKFVALWHSPEVQARVESARKALDLYEVKGVPSFVVDGKYLTSARMAGGTKEVMQVVQYLVERAGAERRQTK